jgi:large subunit ribosomal protein L46
MNTWFVGNAPVGMFTNKFEKPIIEPGKEILGEKTFFMKARIMAGQFNLKNSTRELSDFKWLSKDELEKQVDPAYWKAIRNMLVDL